MKNNIDLEYVSEYDRAWDKIFSELNILEFINNDDIFKISASEIFDITKKDPNLMVKMDSSEDRYEIFEYNDLSIIQQSDKQYLIGKFDAFLPLDYSGHVKTTRLIPNQNSDISNPMILRKESEIVLNAYNYRLLSEVCNSNDDLRMVSYGFHESTPFSYSIKIKDKDYSVDIAIPSTEIELGGVFESLDCVLNVKAVFNQYPDFIGRQLYYPYRVLSRLTNKPIFNLLLTATSTGSIYAHIYRVNEKEDYNSMEQIDIVRYDFFEPISIADIRKILYDVQIVYEPSDIMFPQADSVDRLFQVIDIVKLQPGITSTDIGKKMNLTGRQGAYYSAACVYLGLLKRDKYGRSYKYRLTDYAKEMIESSWKQRNMMMIRVIARHLVFYHFIKQYLDSQKAPSKVEITEWLSNNIDKMNCANGTPARRAGTVLGWINWVVQITTYDDF